MFLMNKDFQKERIFLRWQPTYAMLGDVLTKSHAPKELIRNMVTNGKFKISEDTTIRNWAAKTTRTRKLNDEM